MIVTRYLIATSDGYLKAPDRITREAVLASAYRTKEAAEYAAGYNGLGVNSSYTVVRVRFLSLFGWRLAHWGEKSV